MLNKDTGIPITLSGDGRREVLNRSDLRLVTAIPAMIEEGVYVGVQSPDRRRKPLDRSLAYHFFHANLNIDGKRQVAHFIVRQDINGAWYYHHQVGPTAAQK